MARITQLRGSEAVFLGTMVALSLPFIWVGVILTTKRLRSAGLPSELVALFFVPFLNLAFFLVLSLLPARKPLSIERLAQGPKSSFLNTIIPESALGSAALSMLLTVPFGLGFALLASQMLANYGWGLFVALPYAMGFGAASLYGTRQPRSLRGCVGVACLSTAGSKCFTPEPFS